MKEKTSLFYHVNLSSTYTILIAGSSVPISERAGQMRERSGKRDKMLRGMECEGKVKSLLSFSLKKEVTVKSGHSYKTKKAEKIHRKHFFITSYIRKTRCHLNDQASGLSQYTQRTILLCNSFPQNAIAAKRIN